MDPSSPRFPDQVWDAHVEIYGLPAHPAALRAMHELHHTWAHQIKAASPPPAVPPARRYTAEDLRRLLADPSLSDDLRGLVTRAAAGEIPLAALGERGSNGWPSAVEVDP